LLDTSSLDVNCFIESHYSYLTRPLYNMSIKKQWRNYPDCMEIKFVVGALRQKSALLPY